VKLLMRFLCDTGLSGGAWLYLPPAGGAAAGAASVEAAVEAAAAAAVPAQGYVAVASSSRLSTCDMEVVAPWRSLQSLTPDATQLADPDWCPEVVRQAAADSDCSQAAAAGDAGNGDPMSAEEGSRPRLTPRLAAAVLAARDGRIAPLTVVTVDVLAAPCDMTNRTPVAAKDDPVICIGCDVRTYGTPATAAAAAAADVTPHGRTGGQPTRVVFMVTGNSFQTHGSPPPSPASMEGAELRCFASEADMLLDCKEWLLLTDPDIITTFQVRDTL
ncbi:hypothetical protein Agub_g1153, partial [Astrephomene gubernaculifera]